jgi:hypothetical protein
MIERIRDSSSVRPVRSVGGMGVQRGAQGHGVALIVAPVSRIRARKPAHAGGSTRAVNASMSKSS